jgi:hypothetical protein
MEILIVAAILVVVLSAGYVFQANVFKNSATARSILEAEGELRRTLTLLSAELRQVAPANTGSYAIASAASSSLIFFSDTDGDGLRERVRYFLVDNDLKRGIIKPSGSPYGYDEDDEVIKTMVCNLVMGEQNIFDYYNGETEILAEPVDIAQIRMVDITLIVEDNPRLAPEPITLSTKVALRILKDNH